MNLAPPVRVTGTLGLACFALVQLPAWGVVICALAFLALAGLQTVMPQDSRDRLAWWANRRAHRYTTRESKHGDGVL